MSTSPGRELATTRRTARGCQVIRAWRARGSAISACVFAAAMLSSGASAHDYWMQAEKYHVAPEEAVVVHLDMGESFKVEEEKSHEAARTEKFELRIGSDTRDLLPTTAEGARPIFNEAVSPAQPFLLSLVRGAARIEMPAAEFNEYVAHEGIPGVVAHRTTERERYWRFLKLLGRAGEGTETDLHHRFTGMQLEIVLLQNPFTLGPGEEQIVQVLFETRPLAGATVFALHRNAAGALTNFSAVTDARGSARFLLPERGPWLIRTVHMRPCKGCSDADWESFWASYSFEN